MNQKIIVCRCEDVTLDDVIETLERGYASVEEIKRSTGLGTGPCQGQECMLHAAMLCLQRAGRPAEKIEPFTARPPLGPAPLGLFAGSDEGADKK